MKFVSGIISAVLVVLFGYYLNLKSPELAYQLSGPITVDASPPGATPRIVQQIEIANTGNAVAQKVQVRIRKSVGMITVTKDSESDTYQQFKVPEGGTELDYESLRSTG